MPMQQYLQCNTLSKTHLEHISIVLSYESRCSAILAIHGSRITSQQPEDHTESQRAAYLPHWLHRLCAFDSQVWHFPSTRALQSLYVKASQFHMLTCYIDIAPSAPGQPHHSTYDIWSHLPTRGSCDFFIQPHVAPPLFGRLVRSLHSKCSQSLSAHWGSCSEWN